MSFQFRFAFTMANYDPSSTTHTSTTENSATDQVNIGDLVVVAIPYRTSGTDATMSFSDNLGNTYHELDTPRFFSTSNGNVGAKFYWSKITNPGGCTLTAVPSIPVSSFGILACCYSGFVSSPQGPAAGFVKVNCADGTDLTKSNPITPNVLPLMQIGFWFATTGPSSGSRWVAGTGFNDRLTGQKVGNSADLVKFIDGRVTSFSDSVAKLTGSGGTTGNEGLFTTFSFIENNTEPLITGVSSTSPQYLSTLTVTGQNFSATQGSSTIDIEGVAQNVTAWANGSFSITVDRGWLLSGVPVMLNAHINGVTTSIRLNSIEPKAGWSYINLGTLAASGRLHGLNADIIPALQIAYTGGKVFRDGTYAVDPTVSDRVLAEAGDPVFGWGALGTEVVNSTVSTGHGSISAGATAVGSGVFQTATPGSSTLAGTSSVSATGNAIVSAQSVIAGASISISAGRSTASGLASAAGSSTAPGIGIDITQRLDLDLPFTQSTYNVDDTGFISIDASVDEILIDAEVTYAG
jgi:hypothetical protein